MRCTEFSNIHFQLLLTQQTDDAEVLRHPVCRGGPWRTLSLRRCVSGCIFDLAVEYRKRLAECRQSKVRRE
jgi:hypothetical protein